MALRISTYQSPSRERMEYPWWLLIPEDFLLQGIATQWRRVFGWRICGCIGIAGAILLFLGFMGSQGVQPCTSVIIILGNLVFSLCAIPISDRIFGGPRLVLYEQILLNFLFSILMMIWTSSPLLAGLDGWAISTAFFLAVGRIGCLLAGCCYGRPSNTGVSIKWRLWHGAPSVLRSVRLIPVQSYESLVLFLIFGGCLIVFLGPHSQGDILVLFLTTYGTGRFGLEFLRGDSRPYFLSLSESQWFSIGTALCVACAVLPSRESHSGTWSMMGILSLIGIAIAFFSVKELRRKPWISPLSKTKIIKFLEWVNHSHTASPSDCGNNPRPQGIGDFHGILFRKGSDIPNIHLRKTVESIFCLERADEGTEMLLTLLIRHALGKREEEIRIFESTIWHRCLIVLREDFKDVSECFPFHGINGDAHG